MKPLNVFLGVCLSLLLLTGMAAELIAQQPAAPPDTSKSDQAPDKTDGAPATTDSAPPQPSGADKSAPPTAAPPAAQSPGGQPNVTIDRRIETRTERVEREPARILGMDPTVAAIIGAALLVVIVLSLVAMSRREDPHHTRA